MRPGFYLAALLALLLLSTASAQARTMIIEPAGAQRPYQRWVDESFAPTPNVTVSVSEDATMCGGSPCTNYTDLILFPIVPIFADRLAFMHEVGHIWDFQVMRPRQRARFVHIIGRPNLPWNERSMPPDTPYRAAEEWFADAYAVCALRKRLPRDAFGVNIGDGVLEGDSMWKVCGMIRHTPV